MSEAFLGWLQSMMQIATLFAKVLMLGARFPIIR